MTEDEGVDAEVGDMRQRLKDIFRGPVVFYPLLFAAFPILFLYAYNISQTSASQVWLPLGISVGGAIVMWAVLSLMLRSPAKAGLATAIFLGLFFSYGHLYEMLEARGAFAPKHAHLLPTVLFIWGYCVYFISRAKRDFRVTTRLLNVVAVAVIAINLFNIASYEIRLRGVEAEAPPETTQQPLVGEVDLENLPDIYFIVLDEYAHPDTMLEWYEYDNSEFIQGLEDRGFFVASGSRTRTPFTPQIIAQVLNMEYVTPGWYLDVDIRRYVELESGVVYHETYVWNDVMFRKLAYSAAAEFLKAQGYQYIAFAEATAVDRWDSYMLDSADLYVNYFVAAATPWVSEFQEVLWQTTMLRPFYYHLVGGQYEVSWRRQTLSTLEDLKQIPDLRGPKFVFAHFMCPHQPFVFGPDGEYIAPMNWANYGDKQFYLGQYVFISREIEKVVDELLKGSEIPPIIVVQSDHGIRPHFRNLVIGPDEWRKILSVMYLPGIDYNELCESISPVNTFRLIFNNYFGTEYEMLPDD